MDSIRRGSGTPLLMIHGLGGSHASWNTIADALTPHRELILVDLPGFGGTPPLPGAQSIAALTDAVEEFLDRERLEGVDVVGTSMGARMVLELVRRGRVGNAVALNPGGFWTDRQAKAFLITLGASIKLVKTLQGPMPFLTSNPVARTLLFAQLSAAPWELDADAVLAEMRSFASSPVVEDVLRALATGPRQEGAPAGTARGELVLGWGRRDLVTLPSQAARAQALFPDARLHWFERCGHFPQWDRPTDTAELILQSTSQPAVTATA